MSKAELLQKCKDLGIKCSQSLKKEDIQNLINEREKVSTFCINQQNDHNVNFVYHLADIHIRYLERHQEYKDIFDSMFNQIKENGNASESVMVICGDVFHTRDRFVSETIVLFDEFIKNATALMPVFIIIGNHDCFSHTDRLDTISGITGIAHYDNLHVLKHSGFYVYRNIVFGLSSITDGRIVKSSEWVNTGGSGSGITLIGLHHGIVSGSVLDNGQEAKGAMALKDTEGYDIFLLGDIHRRQFVGNSKRVAYPGSLIQQSFGEERSHGYLLWDLHTHTSTYHEIKNEWSYIDIPLETDVSKIRFTRFSRIRFILSPEHTETDVVEKTDQIKQFTEIKSIKKILSQRSNLNSPQESTTEIHHELSSREHSIISEMLKDNTYLEPVLSLHNSLMTKHCDFESNELSLPWCISKMEFRNIFSYGNDTLNTIVFNDGITGILAKNASGKTSILNCIMYGLFGNIYRSQNHMNKNIISRFAKKEGLFVKLTIKFFDDRVFYIERTASKKMRSRIKSVDQTDITETLKFYTPDKVLNASTKTDTEKLLRDTLSFMGKEEFVLTNMMSNISYGKNMSIINMTSTELDDVFNNMFNLGKYKVLHKEAKLLYKKTSDDIKTRLTKIEMVNSDLAKYNEQVIVARIQDVSDTLTSKTNEKLALQLELDGIDEKLLKLKNVGIKEDETSLMSQIDTNLSRLDGVNIPSLLDSENDLHNEYEILKEKYKSNNYKKLCESPFPKSEIHEDTQTLSDKIQFLSGKIQKIEFAGDMTNEYIRARKYMKSLQSTECLDISSVSSRLQSLQFNKDLDAYIIPAKIHKSLISDLNKQYTDPTHLLKMKKVIEDKENRDKTIAQNIEYEQEINQLKLKLRQKTIIDAHNCKKSLLSLSNKLDLIDLHYDTEDLKEKINILRNNRNINALLTQKNKIVADIDNLTKDIQRLSTELSIAERDLSTCRDLMSKKDTLVPEIVQKEKDLECIKLYVDITHSKNLPKTLISNVVKNICDDANSMIYNACGLRIEIQDNEKWEIVIKKDEFYLGPSSCSGYERFILNTALKMSFDKYKQLSSIKLFLIDEVIDCVSEENFDNIDVVFDILQNHYKKVIVISHNEELKRKINQRILINVDSGVSSIV